MNFTQIILTDYKNYRTSQFSFERRIVGICGINGKGKTNLLDAINYLCFTRSYFNKNDSLNVHFGSEGFRLEGALKKGNLDSSHRIVCIYRSAQKKEIYLDNVEYEKFSQHIGKFPCVMIAPDDIGMIMGGSEERRKFLDTLISQADPLYLQQLITYNKVLQQRNAFLKNEGFRTPLNTNLLDTLDRQLSVPARYIYQKREEFTGLLFPLVSRFYSSISGDQEEILLQYESQLTSGDPMSLLGSSRARDIASQRSTTGTHRDELQFMLGENLFRQVASQGQRKSLLFACKLAEFEILKDLKSTIPILLLDDVFEKLDARRMKNLLQYVCRQNKGQVFITDTHRERLENELAPYSGEVQIVEIGS